MHHDSILKSDRIFWRHKKKVHASEAKTMLANNIMHAPSSQWDTPQSITSLAGIGNNPSRHKSPKNDPIFHQQEGQLKAPGALGTNIYIEGETSPSSKQ